MSEHGLPKEQIDQLEAKIDTLTFSSIVDRFDAVFAKAWSYQFDGPEVVDIPTKVPRNTNAKNPRVFKIEDRPYYKCSCTIVLHVADVPIIREYTLQVPVEEGSFEVARDLTFIYAAHHGWGCGKKSIELFPITDEVSLPIGEEPDVIEIAKQELDMHKVNLGINKMTELDPFVFEWSGGEMCSYKNINKKNICNFNEFLLSKVKANL